MAMNVVDQHLKMICSDPTAVPVFGESKYLTALCVFGDGEPSEEIYSNITSLKPRAGNIVPQYPEIKDKIRAALKLLNFREQRVLIQFWSPHVVGKQQFLTTVDQPFGLGAVGPFLYRRDSECNPFLVDKDHEEEDSGPPARVYRRGLPEWTPDLINYTPEDFPLQQSAIRCNLKGYLALPVFDSTTSLCVGVLELSTSSKYMSYAYEVQNIHEAFKTVNLRTPQVFDWSTSNIPNERRQIRMDKIHTYLKVICEKYGLPLAQTWAMSPFGSYVPHAKGLDKNCSSFNTRCIGKACMSTSGLPFFVRDLGMWHFREACRERHLEKCGGFVWRVFLSHGSCFCGDVSELSEEEYPLVHNARMSGLTSCFTIFLRDDHDEYVLEFFLPVDIKDDRYVSNLVRTLEETIKVTSGFELGDVSSIEIFRPGGIKKLCLDFESIVANVPETDARKDRKRKIESLMLEPDSPNASAANVLDTDILTVKARFKGDKIRFPFSVSSRLSELENEVAQRVKSPGGRHVLKYRDEDNDLIRIACDDDLDNLISGLDDTTLRIIVELAPY